MQKKIILYELNEVPFRVLDTFCAKYPGSALARKLPSCRQYETVSEDTEPLSPWFTWPSLHRGVSDHLHQIHDFGQDLQEADQHYPPIWKILARNKVRSGVCGSLHSYPMPPVLDNYAFYLPDSFALTPAAFPQSLVPFQQFNLSMARDSARNASQPVPVGSTLQLLAQAPALGLRLKTLAAIGGQVTSEIFQRWRATRRRAFQGVLQFDVFAKLLETMQPQFATFFTNHVAAAMHRYWAAAFPGDYERNEYKKEWITRYSGEIEFAMRWADSFFATLTRFVDKHPDYVLWVATSMGQCAWLGIPLYSQLYLHDIDRFMRMMGLENGSWSRRPAMLPKVNVVVSEPFADSFERSLRELKIEGKPVEFSREPGGFFSVAFGQKNLDTTPQIAMLGDKAIAFEELGLKPERIEDETDSSGYHVKNGILLVYDPTAKSRQDSHRRQVSTLEIAPAILRNYSLPVPSYMITSSLPKAA